MQNAHAIAAALGMKIRKPGVCPACGYNDAFVIDEKDGRTLVYCHACGDTDAILGALRLRGLWCGEASPEWTPPPARSGNDERMARAKAFAVKTWRDTVPAGDATQTAIYLRTRIPGLTEIPPTIRHHIGLKHRDTGLTFPTMVSAVTVWPERTPRAIHRTFLRLDGAGKAGVSKPKQSLGPIAGGAVRLTEHGPVLAVTEGIETGLSVLSSTGIPTWAALSTGGMRALILPDDAREVLIAADNDAPGLEAAGAAADRWEAEGRKVRIAVPPVAGMDFNDCLAEVA